MTISIFIVSVLFLFNTNVMYADFSQLLLQFERYFLHFEVEWRRRASPACSPSNVFVYKIGRKMFRPTFLETRKAFIDVQPVS